MFAQTEVIPVTCDASGDATVYSSKIYNGAVVNIIYTKTNFADTVDFTITGETTGQSLWVESNVTASKVMSPAQAVHLNTSGAAQTGLAQQLFVCNERIKIVVAQGGNATTGSFRIVIA